MAGAERSWTKTLAVAVLLMGAVTAGLAQSSQTLPAEDTTTGSLTGKVTDLYSKPLEGVVVVLRNQATGAEARTTTTKNGTYRFSGLEPGEYTLEAESPQLGRGQVGGIVVDAGHEARVQAALEMEPFLPNPVPPALPGVNRPDLEPTALRVNEAALAAEPLRLLPLNGHRVSAEIPQTTAFEWYATLAAEPLQTLALAGQSWEGSAPTSVEASGQAGMNDSQVSEARPGAPASSMPVLAASQESSPAAPASTTTMSAAELQALPVSGRHWQDYVLDNTPTSTTPAGGQGQISLRSTGQPAEIAVDGIGRGLAFGPTNGTNESGQGSSGRGALGQGGAGPAGMAQVGIGGHGLAISEMAIRTVETVAGNVEAAVSRAAGGRMNVETQRGSNELHGQGFLFDRDNVWGARNPFTQWVKETAPATLTTIPVFTPESYTPPDRETVWGIGVGSRIRRNKLFWFAALDSYQRNDPGLATVKHPYLCANPPQCTEQTGFFAQPTNDQMQVLSARLGLSSTNPVAEGLAAYSPMLETLDGLLGPAPRTATQWTGFGRLDWEATERHRFTLEGIGAKWNSPGGGLTSVSETYGNHSFGSTKASEEWLLGRWEAFLTPNLLAVTQASAGRAIQEARPETPSAFEQTFLAGNAWGQLPQMVVDSRYGFTIGNPSRFGQGSYPDEHLYQGQESVDWIRGKLLVKAGFEASHNADATSLLRNQTGTYYYANVENFASDALVFGKFGLTDALDPNNQHNCDQTGKVWRDSAGTLRGLGYLPCYSYYSQTMGPSIWHLSTNDWAGYATAQWQPTSWRSLRRVALGAGTVAAADCRAEQSRSPADREAAQPGQRLGSAREPGHGNRRKTLAGAAAGLRDVLWAHGKPDPGNGADPDRLAQRRSELLHAAHRQPERRRRSAVSLRADRASGQRGQAGSGGVCAQLPQSRGASGRGCRGREAARPLGGDCQRDGEPGPPSAHLHRHQSRHPTSLQTITYAVVDATGAGPIKASQITVPFYASWPTSGGVVGRLNPDYQQITNIESRANSTYEAAMLKVVRYGHRGLSLHAHYTYSHAMDWNPNESAQAAGNDVLDPANFSQEYGTSNLDLRHSAGGMVIYETPWKLRGRAGKLGNGWMLSGVGQFRSGLPYTMRTSGSLPEEFTTGGAAIVGLGPGMNGSGGDNRVYGLGNDGQVYNIGRNTYRYPATWKADLRLGRRFDLGHMRQLELLAESFNLFNHQNVTELETTGYSLESGSTSSLPTLNFLTGPITNTTTGLVTNANTTAFGQPLNINATNFYRERQIQFGLRLRF